MMMFSSRKIYDEYIEGMKQALKNSTVLMDRLNDAVARIISVKLALGIAKQKQKTQMREHNEKITISEVPVAATTEYEDSLQAVHESLVLLKNANILPIKPSGLEYVVLVGEKIININNLAKNELFLNYDNIGMQSGGWSLRWQGFEGNSQWKGDNKKNSNATSILDALEGLKQKVINYFMLVRNCETQLYDIYRNHQNWYWKKLILE